MRHGAALRACSRLNGLMTPEQAAAQRALAERFLDLHRPGQPLLLPNAWDAGSARLLASLGFDALATTSSGFAATLGRPDGSVTRDEALAHAAAGVAETVRLIAGTGLAGCSVEDYTRREDDPVYDLQLAADRVAAAAEAATAGPARLVLTARAENYLHGRPDLA